MVGSSTGGRTKSPAAKWCPYNFFRTSNDIQAEWSSVFKNLQSVAPHQPWLRSAGEVVTGLRCFAYPDSLEVGNLKSYAKDGSKNMSQFRMHRSNFGTWCVVSSPLILEHDLTDDLVMDKIWPIITNRHAINISQSFGDSLHPGGLVRTWSPSDSPSEAPNTTTQFVWALNDDPATTGGWTAAVGTTGPVRHHSVGANVDLCLTVPVAGRQKGKVSLSGCVTPMQPNQTWLYETNGSLIHPAWQEPTKGSKKTHAATCLVLANGRGPSVELFQCKPGGNEKFSLATSLATACCAVQPSAFQGRPQSGSACQHATPGQATTLVTVRVNCGQGRSQVVQSRCSFSTACHRAQPTCPQP